MGNSNQNALRLTKKILTIVAICTVSISVLMLILAIFGVSVFQGVLLNLLLSFATIAVASALAINSVNLLNKNRVVSIIATCLLAICTIFALIIYWSNIQTPIAFNKLTILLGIASVFFNIIVSFTINFGKNFKALQWITYSLIIVLDIILTLIVLDVDVFALPMFWEIFAVICLVVFALICTMLILGKKLRDNPPIEKENSNEYVKILKTEYEELKRKANEYDNLMKNK